MEAKLKFLIIMFKITKQKQVAGAGDCSAMEQRPFQKRVQLKNHKSRENILFLIVAIFAFGSCSTYKGIQRINVRNEIVQVDSYADEGSMPNKKVAMLVCNDIDIPKHDIKNLEFESYIKKMLSTKGYSFTDNNEEANIVIFYEYGISTPREYTRQEVVPIWGQTGIAASTTITSRQRSVFTGRPYMQQSTFNMPSYGVIDAKVVERTEIKYLCWANISAFDIDSYRKRGEDKMLWLTDIISEGQSNDLRYIFRYMIAGAGQYLGRNSNQRVSMFITEEMVSKLNGIPVKVIINQATTGKKDPQATVSDDVYKDRELIIRAGTSVKISMTKPQKRKAIFSDNKHQNLMLLTFLTTSVYGNNILLNGKYVVLGKSTYKVRQAGMWMTLFPPYILPISIPMWCVGDYNAKIPAGTILNLEME